MIVVLRRLLRAERVHLLVIGLAMTLWFALIMLVTRSAADDLRATTSLFNSPLTRGFGLGNLATADGLLAQLTGVSFNHPIVLALVGGVTVTYGARACQGELRAGTLEPTLARSISRTSYLLAYVALIVLSLVALLAVCWASMIGFERAFGLDGTLDPGRTALLCLNAGLAFLGFGAIALLASVLLRARGSASFVTIGILVAMFAITFAERAWDAAAFEWIGPLSLFHWYDAAPILLGADVPTSHLLVPALESIVLIVIALVVFERRDL